MPDISRQRCFNHSRREAVALCPECRQFFCRECITEHDSKVLCANCLSGIKSSLPDKKRFSSVLRGLLFLGTLFFLWFFFYHFGQSLLKLPDSFHEGTLWKEWWQNL